MSIAEQYRAKLISPEKAAMLVKDGMYVEYGMGTAMPELIDAALAKRAGEVKDVVVRGTMAVRPLKIVEADPTGESFCYNSWHFSGYERRLYEKGMCHFIPMLYRNQPLHYRRHISVDVCYLSVAPLDGDGNFSFSLINSSCKAITEAAKTVVLEINEHLPRVCSDYDGCINIADVDYIVEGEHPHVVNLPFSEPNETDMKVASFIANELCDGAVLELGIGGMPSAVGKILAESDLKDFGIHTEMLTDGFLALHKRGKITNRSKRVSGGKSVFTFAFGSDELYDWITENPATVSMAVDKCNDPRFMSQNDKLMTVNNCIEMDLFGQVCAESSGYKQISGPGGQLDYLEGGMLSNGGKSFICMSSTFFDKKSNSLRSRLVPTLPAGGIVTAPRACQCYVVTEWGIENMLGKSVWERAEALVRLAHPDFRDELIKEADKMNIWRRSNRI